jgi:hypothetical protein
MFGGPVVWNAGGKPIESPVERTNDPILGDRRETMFPGVEEMRDHDDDDESESGDRRKEIRDRR